LCFSLSFLLFFCLFSHWSSQIYSKYVFLFFSHIIPSFFWGVGGWRFMASYRDITGPWRWAYPSLFHYNDVSITYDHMYVV
jgi:hypothetical protein